MLYRPTTNDLAYHRVAAEPVGVVHVLVAGEAREDRLSQETGETVPTVVSGSWIGDKVCCRVCQTQGVVEFAME